MASSPHKGSEPRSKEPSAEAKAINDLMMAAKTEAVEKIRKALDDITLDTTSKDVKILADKVVNKQKLDELSKLDARSSGFFGIFLMQHILSDVLTTPVQLPHVPFTYRFSAMQAATNDPQMMMKFIQILALPIVQQLIRDLDKVDPNIIDQFKRPSGEEVKK